MKQVSQIVGQTGQSVAVAPLNDQQKDSVVYFFLRLKLTYGNQYSVNMPDEKTESLIKREYARQVFNLTRQKIDKGFDSLHKMRQSDPEKWRFMDIDQVIGVIKNGVEGVARAPGVRETADRLKGLEHKRSPEEIQKAVSLISKLRGELK